MLLRMWKCLRQELSLTSLYRIVCDSIKIVVYIGGSHRSK